MTGRSLGFCLLILGAFSCWTEPSAQWNVTDFGAVGDGLTVNTKAIQRAIDTCSATGGGEVIIEDGVFVTGTILLKDGVTLNVSNGATLLGSDNPNDYRSIDPFVDATGQLRGKCLVGALDAESIGITGSGTIDGRGDQFTRKQVEKTLLRLGQELVESTEDIREDSLYAGGKVSKFDRPFLLRMVRAKNISIKDIHLRQPAAWTIHFYQCQGFSVDGVDIYSHANRNNDGIDLDSSTDGTITNCNIDSGDDAICFKTTSPQPTENIVVKDCRLSSEWGAIKFGTESMGDFRNIIVRNTSIHDTKGGGIKILSVDGANISNIMIDSIDMKNVEMPVFIRLGERRLVYRDATRQPVGSISGVTIRNITASVSREQDLRLFPTTALFITGTPGHSIGKVSLESIRITLPGGGTAEHRSINVPESEMEYPEFTKLGATPAYGLFARHIDQLLIKDINFNLLKSDKREKEVLVNVVQAKNQD
ncbi:glycoside hydrolase family 28 protein [Neolewinella agarilytica]|uniref:Glycosyl hydrolases family 28 n=1 Tax=Neolewinella agarilytica TaxID=478744 RepID=A0A1H9KLT5_9BACT|nr:glycosyl hydrolase family 28 protein [Neolewinella agarilytica]SEQ99885.1 Glycosyl hydrolases family 28 [Neolewinella agarilytica]